MKILFLKMQKKNRPTKNMPDDFYFRVFSLQAVAEIFAELGHQFFCPVGGWG